MEKLYIIWDTRLNEQVIMGSGKAFWPKKGSAKNALLNHIYGANDHYLTKSDMVNATRHGNVDGFNGQTRYECWECNVVKSTKV